MDPILGQLKAINRKLDTLLDHLYGTSRWKRHQKAKHVAIQKAFFKTR